MAFCDSWLARLMRAGARGPGIGALRTDRDCQVAERYYSRPLPSIETNMTHRRLLRTINWKNREPLVAAIPDFHPPYPITRNYQHQRRNNDQTGHGNPGRCWFRDHREGTLRNRHWHQRIEIVNHADFFQ